MRSPIKGFTLIELLVVIAIIGILATIVLVSLGTATAKGRDARREEDMHTIYTAFETYYTTYGCLPAVHNSSCPGVGAYSELDDGGWDMSSMGGWLTFLQNSGIMSKVPLDPVNNYNTVTNPTGDAYRYYCDGSAGIFLGYYSEVKHTWLNSDGSVYTAAPDTTFTCK